MRYRPFIKPSEWVLIGACALAGVIVSSLHLII